MDGFGQCSESGVRESRAFLGAWFTVSLGIRVALEEDRRHTQVSREFNIGRRVADHDASDSFDLRKLSLCLVEKTGQGLAAIALPLVMRAEIEAVDLRAIRSQHVIELLVNRVYIGGGVEAQSDAALIGKHENAKASLVQLRDRFGNSGK